MSLPGDIPARPEERIVRQLIAAALYENLFGPLASAAAPARPFEWRSGAQAWRARGRLGAFGRPRLEPGTVECRTGSAWRQASIADAVAALPGAPQEHARLAQELGQTEALVRWNRLNAPRHDRRLMSFSTLDAAIDEGHPYHPCFKSRTGFDEHDHRCYGPEAGGSFQLVWLAVARDHIDLSLPDTEETFWQRELGASGLAEIEARAAALGLEHERFGLMPIHPWQWHDLSTSRLRPLFEAGHIHYLGAAGDAYRASQSVRTLCNAQSPCRSNVKLSLGIVNTSTRRNIEAHSVATAPLLSRWLDAVLDGDPLFKTRYRLDIVREFAGAIVDRDGSLEGDVAAIWRESVESKLADGERAVPFNALMAIEADGLPFIDPWLQRYGIKPWLDRLIDVAVLPVWRLLVVHGIATEAHGQNMVLVHRDGWPERLILRDFHDSLEFVPDFLADPNLAPDFPALDPRYRGALPNQYYWMERPEDLRDLFVDCLFVFNLSEISHLVQSFYGISEGAFWHRVSLRLAADIAEHGLGERVARLGFGAPEIVIESLLARKLGLSGDALQHKVPNPLTAVAPIAREYA
ncbi:siderophore synthetase component [Rhodopseudomonas thermotolerans]|uniref:Siderophore synthetase component n=2 Tax=Rhodopseudomonas TaxID=1073 RepID=A0A336JNZ7_9BRAD|nr:MULTISPECIES: IucA/IucC family protein [Rhodopseudomonas]RED33196.1 siderophore synthetase component [Rhodopseudomonas pentothenatexigens]REF93945.1 siderophore synthetase component [Rhodopseudomonas thermotolerans]SSW91272.1 siderophore synthetase component [Rhodopseudomonas pentothenatexigens]